MAVQMRIRPAAPDDISRMHCIRMAVSNNRLADPTAVTEQSYVPYVAAGSAWVAESGDAICGFAIVDAPDRSVWALFVDPGFEGAGIGRDLHEQLITWSRDQALGRLTLSTEPGTRAEHFYRARGWVEYGVAANNDLCSQRDL